MTNAIAAKVRNAARFMAVDELGNLWISGDGLKNANNRKDLDRLLELGAVTCYGPGYYHVNEGYASLLTAYRRARSPPEMAPFLIPTIPAPRVV